LQWKFYFFDTSIRSALHPGVLPSTSGFADLKGEMEDVKHNNLMEMVKFLPLVLDYLQLKYYTLLLIFLLLDFQWEKLFTIRGSSDTQTTQMQRKGSFLPSEIRQIMVDNMRKGEVNMLLSI